MRSLLYFSSELLKPTPAFLVVSSASLFGLPISPEFSKIPGFIHKLKNPDYILFLPTRSLLKNYPKGASLVAQWLRICLPMQGTRVRALVWEDPTCRGATGPVSHNY